MAETVVQDIYDRTIKVLPAAQRLALATLILMIFHPSRSSISASDGAKRGLPHFPSQAGWGQADAFGGEKLMANFLPGDVVTLDFPRYGRQAPSDRGRV